MPPKHLRFLCFVSEVSGSETNREIAVCCSVSRRAAPSVPSERACVPACLPASLCVCMHAYALVVRGEFATNVRCPIFTFPF